MTRIDEVVERSLSELGVKVVGDEELDMQRSAAKDGTYYLIDQ